MDLVLADFFGRRQQDIKSTPVEPIRSSKSLLETFLRFSSFHVRMHREAQKLSLSEKNHE